MKWLEDMRQQQATWTDTWQEELLHIPISETISGIIFCSLCRPSTVYIRILTW
jgi:hypothetical protein